MSSMTYQERKAARTKDYQRWHGVKLVTCTACGGYCGYKNGPCAACDGTGKERGKPNAAEIIVKADTLNLSAGAVVTGYAISERQPSMDQIIPCPRSILARVYHGFGKLRAETRQLGDRPPQRGFGRLIGDAEIADREINQGKILWLRVED